MYISFSLQMFEQYNLCEADRDKCECCIKEIDCPYFNKETTEILPSEPLPYIGSMTDTGLFEIRWDKEMQDLGDLATIKQSAVQMIRDRQIGRNLVRDIKNAI